MTPISEKQSLLKCTFREIWVEKWKPLVKMADYESENNKSITVSQQRTESSLSIGGFFLDLLVQNSKTGL